MQLGTCVREKAGDSQHPRGAQGNPMRPRAQQLVPPGERGRRRGEGSGWREDTVLTLSPLLTGGGGHVVGRALAALRAPQETGGPGLRGGLVGILFLLPP